LDELQKTPLQLVEKKDYEYEVVRLNIKANKVREDPWEGEMIS
jgi:hypothetical protein